MHLWQSTVDWLLNSHSQCPSPFLPLSMESWSLLFASQFSMQLGIDCAHRNKQKSSWKSLSKNISLSWYEDKQCWHSFSHLIFLLPWVHNGWSYSSHLVIMRTTPKVVSALTSLNQPPLSARKIVPSLCKPLRLYFLLLLQCRQFWYDFAMCSGTR